MSGKSSRKNKVKFNIKNVHYAMRKEDGTGYETPVPIPGAVSITLEAQGELSPFYADGIKYYVASSNGGYEGDLEMALIPDIYRTDVLGEETDTNNVMIEDANAPTREFALGFDIDGDFKTTRFWFWNCTATRPSTESSTTEDKKEPTTDKLSVSCAPCTDGKVRAKTTESTPQEIYNNWYTEVYAPVFNTAV